MTNNLEIELYKLTDSFLTEAKDQNGNDRSLERLNQDRHLFVENCLILIQAEREKAYVKGKLDALELKENYNDLKKIIGEQAVKEYMKTKISKKELYCRGLDAESMLYIES